MESRQNLLLGIILSVSTMLPTSTMGDCSACKPRIEYCEQYESRCQSCEAVCLPPTNGRFKECGKYCTDFLQDFLIAHSSGPQLHTVEVLLYIVTAVSLVTLLVALGVAVVKIQSWKILRLQEKVKENKSFSSHSVSMRTLSTRVSDANHVLGKPRIPSEDRVPSNRSSYENPAMVPSPPQSPATRDVLPPINGNNSNRKGGGPYTISNSQIV